MITASQKAGKLGAADSSVFVVIGAGPSGLTAAYELAKAGKTPIVLEKDNIVGGISRTESYKGYHFDMGGHRFFTKSREVNQAWQEVLAGEFLTRPRLSRIYYNKKFFHYPLKPLNALLGLGFVESILIVLSYIRWQLFPYREEETFEQWVTNRFGKRLFLTFFKTYTEKVWGISCQELKGEWAAQRIKDLSARTILLSMFRKPGTTVKTLIEQFEYPRLGPGMMWRAFADRVRENGGQVRLNRGVSRIYRTGNRVDSVEVDGENGAEVIAGNAFISSMPLTEFVRKLEPPAPSDVLEAAKQLKYRDFLTVCLIVDTRNLFEDNWIYIHDPSVQVGRIQNYKNWSPEMVPDSEKSGLGLEYFCNEGDELWTMSDQQLVQLAKQEIAQLGLAKAEDVVDGCVYRVAKSYPVYDADYREHLTVLREFMDGFTNMQTVGRNGLHRYNNQDHAMLTGMMAVRNLLNGENHNLWEVNADQQYHEEVREEAAPEEEALREILETVFTKLDRVAMGLSVGIISGVLLCAMTVVLVLKGGTVVGPTLSLLSNYFPGYEVTWAGSLIGLLYGLAAGFLLGWVFAALRNCVAVAYFLAVRRLIRRRLLRRFLEFI